MSAASLAQLPLAAGGALAGALMRGVGRAGLAGLRLYLRAPLANTGLLVLVSLTAMATSNALFNQSMPHPAPFFAPPPGVPQPLERPADLASAPPALAPLPEPASASAPVASETTGTVTPVIPDQPVGNAEVFEVQRRLLELGFFQGTIDGYYGPRTAAAIRAFEERHGMTPMGALTPQVVEAITGTGPRAALAPARTEPVAPVQTATAAQPVTPAPAPLQAPAETVTQTATVTIDSIVAAIDGVRATPPQPAEPPVPNAPVPNLAGAVVVPDQPMPPAPVQTAPPADRPEPPAPVATAALEPARTAAGPPMTAANADLVSQVQRGLASLAFLRGPIDGRPSDGLARAIRNFEVYHNYPVTGEIRPELVDMLVAAGATP